MLRAVTRDSENICAECGGPADAQGTPVRVRFAPVVGKEFCGWDHFTAWVNKGEPDWDAEAKAQLMPEWQQLGCYAVMLVLMAIFIIGLLALVEFVI